MSTNLNQIHQNLKYPWYFPKYSSIIFFVLFLLLAWVYNYHQILFLPPQSVHQWRQCDCLSIAQHYLKNHNPFLEPSVHNLGRDGTGKTVSDFPVIYYLMALIWKAVGYHEFLFRFATILFFLTGLYSLFILTENILKDSILAFFISILLFTSPTLVYYANNFLMDIPAFSLALLALYFFYRFYLTAENKFLYLSFLIFTLAGLLKISSLLSFTAVFCLFICERAGLKIRHGGRVFKQPMNHLIGFLFVYIIQLVWYSYAASYNAKYNSGFFLIGTLPFWNTDPAQTGLIFEAIKEHIKWDYFRIETQVIFVIMAIVMLVYHKSVSRMVGIITLFISAGLMLFVCLFFGAFKDHDYYTINLFILVPFIVTGFLLVIKNRWSVVYRSVWLRLLLLVFIIHNADFARRRMEGRYDPEGWQNKNCLTVMNKFEGIEPYLQTIGIKGDDKVISISDNSINISLFLLNRDGWTGFGLLPDSLWIHQKIEMGAKYLVIYDDKIYKEDFIKPYIGNKIGTYRTVDFFLLIN